MNRDIQLCRHRGRLPDTSNDEPAHFCQLLQKLSGVSETRWCCVSQQLCENCCRYTTPQIDGLNPVIASRLYELATMIGGAGGVDGCDQRRAGELVRTAENEVQTETAARGRRRDPQPRNLLGMLSPASKWRQGRRIATWSVGITTARRREPTLARCVESIDYAGWQSPRLFVDGPLALPQSCRQLPVTRRDRAVGAWPNFYLSLAELIMRDPLADAYMMIQDDTMMCRCAELRRYLESVLWPGPPTGIASLYCSRVYTRDRPGWYRFRRVWRWGAHAFVFSPRAAHQFLTCRYVIKHRLRPGKRGRTNVDGVIGRWCHRQRVPLYYPTPSLVQHIGDSSTLWINGRADGDRQADWFASGADDLP